MLQHGILSEKLRTLDIQDTLFYGRLKAAYPDPQEREQYLLELYSSMQCLEKLRQDIKLENLRQYKDLPSLQAIAPAQIEHLKTMLERDMVQSILDGDFMPIQAASLETWFHKIHKQSHEKDKSLHLQILYHILRSIPYVEKILSFQDSAFGPKDPTRLGLVKNQEDLDRLKKQVAELLLVRSSEIGLIFTLIDAEHLFHGHLEDQLMSLKSCFLEISDVNDGRPLAESYKLLKEQIKDGLLVSKSGPNRTLLFLNYEEILMANGIDSIRFRSVLDTNTQKLDLLMSQINVALISLREYQNKLGSSEDFSYHDIVFNDKVILQIKERFHFVDGMAYKTFQQFAALSENRRRLTNRTIMDALVDAPNTPVVLQVLITSAVYQRYAKSMKLSPHIKLTLLAELEDSLEVELRYLWYLVSFADRSWFVQLPAVTNFIRLFKEIIRNDPSTTLMLRKILGRTQRSLHLRPGPIAGLFELNRKALFRALEGITGGQLRY